MSNSLQTEIPPKNRNDIVLASGGVNPELANRVAEAIGVETAQVKLKRHANDELDVRFEETVRGKDVYVIQSHASTDDYKISEAVIEHLWLCSAAVGASAQSVTAIAPYLAHSRGDRKSEGREVVPAPQLIRFFEATDVSAMMSIDLHSPQTVEHLRTGPYEHLTAQPELRRAVKAYIGAEAVANCVVVAPDAGAMKNNNRHAQELSYEEGVDVQAIFMGKERARHDTTQLSRLPTVQGVEGKTCLIFDDMIDGGGTMITAAETLKRSKADQVFVAATHPIFSNNAPDKLLNSEIDKVFVTDTLPVNDAKEIMGDRLEVVRIGPLIGAAIYQIVVNGSISKIFQQQNYH